ncbi:MAG: DUF2851 family protein [Chitinophagales bacterium]
MDENLLHFVWKFRLFAANNLTTTTGESVEVIHPGMHNRDAGADFSNAKVRINNVLWAGNVELHLKSSDWFAHKHHIDSAYDNIVLHVVYENDKQLAKRKNGEAIPVLELKDRINPNTVSRFDELSRRKTSIACRSFIAEVNSSVLNNHLERMLVERLEQKVNHIMDLLKESGNDWEQVMFVLLARYMGAGINKEPFELLAKSLPVKVWAKHSADLLQLEALLLGQAGFLAADFVDGYPKTLKKEYNYLRRLHNLSPLPAHLFKFLRLRPSNFPSLRLAQLASLLHKDVKLFSQVVEAKNGKAIRAIFSGEPSIYWKTHYQFDKKSVNVKSAIGDSAKDILLINAVAPLLFAYGRYKGEEKYADKAMSLLEDCRAEVNSIVKGWNALGIKADSAYQTQALIQLKTGHCDRFNCLQCAVGHKILS